MNARVSYMWITFSKFSKYAQNTHAYSIHTAGILYTERGNITDGSQKYLEIEPIENRLQWIEHYVG